MYLKLKAFIGLKKVITHRAERKGHFILTSSLVLLIVCGLAVSTLAMPPHKNILRIYEEMIKAHPELSPAALRERGIDTPATYPDGTPIYAPHQGPSGSFNALAIIVKFTDNPSSVGASFFDTLVFGPGTGSVRHYYNEVSYGTLDVVTVNLPSSVGWKTAPQTYAYYVNSQRGFGAYPRNAQKLVEDVVALVNPVVDFSQYDNNSDSYVDALFVIHAGPGYEYTGNPNHIHSHKWNTRTPQNVDGVKVYTYSMEPEYWVSPGDMTLGVYSHELGHVFGLPDWYDYGYDSRGIGDWCLMASGSWNGYLGGSPAHISAEGRWRLGFVSAVPITTNISGLAIPQVETNQTNSVFYVWDDGATNNEYFLIENRQKVGYDVAIPGSGLFIWHVDTNMNGNDYQCTNHQNCNCGLHYEVALEQADGDLDLEFNRNYGDTGDPYPGSSSNTTFNLASTPNSGSYNNCNSYVAVTNISPSSSTMYADVDVESGAPLPVPDIKANGSGGSITINPLDTLSVTVSLNTNGRTDSADWWLVADTQFGWYHYDRYSNSWTPGQYVTYQGSLFDLSPMEVLNMSDLPTGTYTFHFGVDTTMDGEVTWESLVYDSVVVNVIE